MKKTISLLLTAAVLTTTATLNAADKAPNTLSTAEKAAGWKSLFDGKSTSEFRNYKKDAVSDGWKVVDGAIVWTKKGAGDLITKKKFGSFELTLEYNISEGGNSGIMFHVTEEGKRPYHSGPEIQVQDNAKGRDPELSGWLYEFYPAKVDATKPAGQWNHVRILMTPGKSVHWMNGTYYCDYVKGSKDWQKKLAASKFAKWELFGKADSGHICLQDHGNVVKFRNLKIREVK